MTPSNVTGIIDRLDEQQLVSRKENPEDRRMSMLQLTAKGTKLISGLREMRDTQMLKVLKNLPEDELATIMKGYSAMAKAVGAFSEKV